MDPLPNENPKTELRLVPPPPVLRLGPDGALRLTAPTGPIAVQARPCFPWSSAGQHIALLDADGKERAMVEDPATLDPPSRRALDRALAESGFVFEIVEILDIDDEYELRAWTARTRQGARRFQTRLDEWPRTVPDGSLLLRDVAGDLYRIPPPATLDAGSRKTLWAYADW